MIGSFGEVAMEGWRFEVRGTRTTLSSNFKPQTRSTRPRFARVEPLRIQHHHRAWAGRQDPLDSRTQEQAT